MLSDCELAALHPLVRTRVAFVTMWLACGADRFSAGKMRGGSGEHTNRTILGTRDLDVSVLPGERRDYPMAPALSHEDFFNAVQATFDSAIRRDDRDAGASEHELLVARRAPAWEVWLIIRPLLMCTWDESSNWSAWAYSRLLRKTDGDDKGACEGRHDRCRTSCGQVSGLVTVVVLVGVLMVGRVFASQVDFPIALFLVVYAFAHGICCVRSVLQCNARRIRREGFVVVVTHAATVIAVDDEVEGNVFHHIFSCRAPLGHRALGTTQGFSNKTRLACRRGIVLLGLWQGCCRAIQARPRRAPSRHGRSGGLRLRCVDDAPLLARVLNDAAQANATRVNQIYPLFEASVSARSRTLRSVL